MTKSCQRQPNLNNPLMGCRMKTVWAELMTTYSLTHLHGVPAFCFFDCSYSRQQSTQFDKSFLSLSILQHLFSFFSLLAKCFLHPYGHTLTNPICLLLFPLPFSKPCLTYLHCCDFIPHYLWGNYSSEWKMWAGICNDVSIFVGSLDLRTPWGPVWCSRAIKESDKSA